MKKTGIHSLIQFQKQWKFLVWLEVFLYAFGMAFMLRLASFDWAVSTTSFIIIIVIALVVKKPWNINLQVVTNYIDNRLYKIEYSSGLLLKSTEKLTSLAKLQQLKIAEVLSTEIKTLRPKHQLKSAVFALLLMIGFGLLARELNIGQNLIKNQNSIEENQAIRFMPIDSTATIIETPELTTQQVSIDYPSYTGLSTSTTAKMNIKAVEGSLVSWKLTFKGPVDRVMIESMSESKILKRKNTSYSGSSRLENSGFYNFKFTDTAGGTYSSEIYSIEVTKDKAPDIRLENLDQFTSFTHNSEKNMAFNTSIIDDFGIAEAYIIATVSKGTGESVKFREERLSFNSPIEKGSKQLNLKKSINLDTLKMEAGDELYFYVEAKDTRQPKANITRSETYFAVIKDTTNYGPGVDAGMGVDLMPDYFRSQRQLIIDTKTLISQRGKIPEKEFNTTSNDLGFDQKSLRLKYGQFMGDEAEGMTEKSIATEDHNHDDTGDPLADYTHDHDGENEHNLVAEEHDHDHGQDKSETEESPLEKYMHNHGDPESATLFTDNLKSKLRRALNIMWDAELHLRLYEPEQSLPYQYQALELIQEIKNSARIYVHRIGFDPPPIKENARLSGDIDDVNNFSKKETVEKSQDFNYIKSCISRLEVIKINGLNLTAADRELAEKAGNELAEKAIEEPGRFLKTLQLLKRLAELEKTEKALVIRVQKGLLESLPQPDPEPKKGLEAFSQLDALVLKSLE